MKICEPMNRKVFKIGDSKAISIPAIMEKKYYPVEVGDEIEIAVYSSDKGLRYSFWIKGK